MGNLFSAFQQDVFRPIVTLLIPGGLTASSWLVGILWTYPKLKDLMGRNATESALIITLIMIALGLVCEDIGAQIEASLDRRADASNSGRFQQTWNAYLRTAFVADPVGRRYIRTLVLRLKFELGCFVALIPALGGVIWLCFIALSCTTAIVLIALGVGFAMYFKSEAASTHSLLADTREEMTRTIHVIR